MHLNLHLQYRYIILHLNYLRFKIPRWIQFQNLLIHLNRDINYFPNRHNPKRYLSHQNLVDSRNYTHYPLRESYYQWGQLINTRVKLSSKFWRGEDNQSYMLEATWGEVMYTKLNQLRPFIYLIHWGVVNIIIKLKLIHLNSIQHRIEVIKLHQQNVNKGLKIPNPNGEKL